MTEKEKELIIKREKMLSLFFEVYEPELKFLDLESDKMLDDKIEVLQALKDGKTIAEIPKFYDVLELMPKNDKWD